MVDSCVKHDWTSNCQQVAYASSVDNRRLERVFDAFRRRELNSAINFADKRGAPRHAFNESIVLALSPGEHEGFGNPVQLAVNGWTINLSKSGLGVVCGRKLHPVNKVDDQTPLLSTNRLLRPGRELRVVFLRDGYEVHGLQAEVVRNHDACEELLDIGIQFCERKDHPLGDFRSLQPFIGWLRPYAKFELRGV